MNEEMVQELAQYSLAKGLPWLKFNFDAQKLTLIVDNHLLSTYRACPTAFMEMHVEGYHPKPGYGVPNLRRWYLDFGIVFHKMVEIYYKEFRNETFNMVEWASVTGYKLWNESNLDAYSQHPEFHAIGGFKGFCGLLLQYASRFKSENEKFRVLGTEIAFGKNREIPIYRGEYIEIYLAGRMDVIVDDGYFIMPMDHKTTGSFRRDPLERYLLDDGPTGYILALKHILPEYVPEEMILKRDCSRILINMISKSVPKDNPMDRFRRLPIYKSEAQLITYKERTIATVMALLEDVYRFSQTKSVPRDTSHCTNWFFDKCPYYDIHRQSDLAGEQATKSNGYVKLPLWDTENIALT